MSGNRTGGLKARDKNLAKDPDFYRRIGSRGGKASGTGGFYHSKANGLDRHIKAGQRGGLKSRKPQDQDLEDLLHYEKPKHFSFFKKRR